MHKSKSKIGPIILKLVLICLGSGFAVFSFIILDKILSEFEFVGLTGFMVFSIIAAMGLYFGVASLKRVVIDPKRKSIDIIYFWFYRTSFSDSEILGFNLFPFNNGFGTYRGILVELVNGKQFQLSEFDTKNFKEIKDTISSYVPYRNDLKLNVWTNFGKFYFAICGLVVVIILTGKLLGWQ